MKAHYASNKYHQLCPEEIGCRSGQCTQRSRSILPCSNEQPPAGTSSLLLSWYLIAKFCIQDQVAMHRPVISSILYCLSACVKASGTSQFDRQVAKATNCAIPVACCSAFHAGAGRMFGRNASHICSAGTRHSCIGDTGRWAPGSRPPPCPAATPSVSALSAAFGQQE